MHCGCDRDSANLCLVGVRRAATVSCLKGRSAYVSLTLALVAATLLGACSLISSVIPCVERPHETGLLLVCDEQFKDMPEELKGAASWGWVLAEDHPDDLGYPWPNPDAKELEFRVLGPRGEAAVRDWMAGNATKLGPKPMDLPRPQVPIKFVVVDRSFRQLQDIQHGVVPPKDLPDGDAIYTIHPDTRRNATVITIERLSDPLLRALAARYGTAAIVIRIDPNRRWTGY